MSKIIEVHCFQDHGNNITVRFYPEDKYWSCENKEGLAMELQEKCDYYVRRPLTKTYIMSLESSLQAILNKWIYYGKLYVTN